MIAILNMEKPKDCWECAENFDIECCGDIRNCPLIDIVTCGECKHWYNDADCGMACEFTNMKQPSDGFCNWGERIDEYEREYRELGLYELRELRKGEANDIR